MIKFFWQITLSTIWCYFWIKFLHYRERKTKIIPTIDVVVEIVGSQYDGDRQLYSLSQGEEFAMEDRTGVFLQAERVVDYPNRLVLSVHMDRKIDD